MTKIKILMVDDEPHLSDDDGFPSFAHQPAGAKAVSSIITKKLSQNFELEWVHDELSACVYYLSLKAARQALEKSKYANVDIPNIIYFDYNLDQSDSVDRRMMGDETFRQKYEELSPNLGLGSMSEFAKGWQNDPRILKGNYIDFGKRSGCLLGAIITESVSDLPCVGIPKTITPDSASTAALEWMLNIPLRGAFDEKSLRLDGWNSFLKKALPRLREHIAEHCAAGIITVFPSALSRRTSIHPPEAVRDEVFMLRHAAGDSQIAAEGLFFDILYPDGKENYNAFVKAVGMFRERIISSTIGQSESIVGEAFRVSRDYINSYESPNFTMRKTVSEEIKEGWIDGGNNLSEPTLEKLESWNVDLKVARRALERSDIKTFKYRIDPQYLPGFLPNLKDAGGGNDIIGRYAAISLMVYVEKIRACLTDSKKAEAAKIVVDAIYSELSDNSLLPSFEELNGVWLSEEELLKIRKTLRDNPSSGEAINVLREILGSTLSGLKNAVGLAFPYSKEEDGETDLLQVKSSLSVEEAAQIFYDLCAPNPLNILMWRESKNKQAEITRPLERLGNKALGIRALDVFKGKLGHDFGLKNGEGQLIALFALAHGFSKTFWPNWMKRAENY